MALCPGQSTGSLLGLLNAKDGHRLGLSTLTSLWLKKKVKTVLRGAEIFNPNYVVSHFLCQPSLAPPGRPQARLGAEQ